MLLAFQPRLLDFSSSGEEKLYQCPPRVSRTPQGLFGKLGPLAQGSWRPLLFIIQESGSNLNKSRQFWGQERSLKFTPEVPAEPGPLAAEPGRAILRGPKTPKNRPRENEKGPRRGPPSVLIRAVRVRSCLPSCPFSSSPDDLAACKSPVGWPSRRSRTPPPPRWASSRCALR